MDSGLCQERELVKPSITSLLYLSVFILLATMDSTLLSILFMFLVILFIAYFDCMLSIVRMSLYSSIRSYSAHPLLTWVSGRQCVSMVLRHCLPADAPYIPGLVVDCGCDTPIKSFVSHSPNNRPSRTWLQRKTSCYVLELPY